jgi:hypothetical protein
MKTINSLINFSIKAALAFADGFAVGAARAETRKAR